MRRSRVFGAMAVAVALVSAACSSGRDEDSAPTTTSPAATSAETTSPETTSAPTTTEASTTTTTTAKRANVKNRCAAGQGNSGKNADSGNRQRKKNAQRKNRERSGKGNADNCPKQQQKTKKPAPKPQVRRMPLTGHVLRGDAKPPQRPALVVKIDNNANARPQAGLNGADIVFEEIVEYGTRFAAVFHKTAANPVGPIRSGRTQDIDMLARLNRPLLAWSGGNTNVVNAISQSPLVSLMHGGAGGFWRSGDRSAPHNLYNSTDALWAQAPGNWQQPDQMFSYVPPGTAFEGTPAAGVNVQMDSDHVRWQYDPGSEKYLRFTNGAPHYAAHGQVTTSNVVILGTRYQPSWADARSPEAVTTGQGEAWVFSRGRMIHGRWSRPGTNAPYRFTTGSGENSTLRNLIPGRTFVELAEVGVDGPPAPIRP